MKPLAGTAAGDVVARIPRLYAAASLKRRDGAPVPPAPGGYSAALCRGLIEAHVPSDGGHDAGGGIPRLYAAASLKRRPPWTCGALVVFGAADVVERLAVGVLHYVYVLRAERNGRRS